MAPEVFARDYSFEADVWSFGVLCYQLFCCAFPFWPGDAYNRALSLEEVAKAIQVRSHDVPLPACHAPSFPTCVVGLATRERTAHGSQHAAALSPERSADVPLSRRPARRRTRCAGTGARGSACRPWG
jgi:serine/threonine protein kinase